MLIGWDNYIADRDNTTITTSGVTAISTLPATNVQDERVEKIWRATDNGTPQLRADLGSAKTIKIVGILGHNLGGQSPAATFRVMLGTSAGASDVYDSTATAIFEPPYSAFPSHQWHILSTAQSARYVTIEYGNNPATIETGALWVSNGWEDAKMQPSYTLAIADPSTQERSRGQQVYTAIRRKYRRLSCTLNDQTSSTIYTNTLSAQRFALEAGRSKPIAVFPKTDTAANIHHIGFYGFLDDAPEFNHIEADLFTVRFVASEAR